MSNELPRWLCEADNQTVLPWFCDAPWVAANGRHGHRFIVRGGDLSGKAVAQAVANSLARTDHGYLDQLLYGNPTARAHEMCGLTTHFQTSDQALAANAVNVLDAGGKSGRPLCSIWLLGWGPRTLFMASPDGDPPGIFGECCVCVADWRYVVRIANVDACAPDCDLLVWMMRATLRLPRLPGWRPDEFLRPIFYLNGDVENRLKDSIIGAGREWVAHFRGVPIRRVNELHADEDRVT